MGVGGVPLELCSEELWEFSERPWDTPSLSSSLSSSFYLLGSWERFFFLKKSFPGFKKRVKTSGLVFPIPRAADVGLGGHFKPWAHRGQASMAFPSHCDHIATSEN